MMHGGFHWHGPGVLHRSGDLRQEDVLGKPYDRRIMGRLLKYLGPHKAWVLLAAVSMTVYALTSLATPYLIKVAIDGFIVQRDLTGLSLVALVFLANGLINWGGQYIQLVSMARVGQGTLYTIRMQLFVHLQRLSLSFFDRNEVGRIMSRVQNDVQNLQELLTSGILVTLSDAITLGGIIFIMVSMNWRLALLTFVVLPIMGLVMKYWQSYAMKAFRRVRGAIAAVNAGLQENISGVRVTQSLSREEANIQRFDDINEAQLDANLQAGRLSAAILPLVELLTAVATGMIIVFGGIQVIRGQLTTGALVAFTLYIQRFFDPIRDLSMRLSQMQLAMASGERIFELLDTPPEVEDVPQAKEMLPIAGEIKFKDVSFSYGGAVEVLHRMSLHLQPGETVALVGPTGAGKSTVLNLVERFYDVTEGAILIDGQDTRQVSQGSLRRQMSLVLQEPFLFSGTIGENIAYGKPEATREEVVAAAKAVGAHVFIERLEKGYDTQLQERGVNLSAGQRQLISFARAVLINPRILLLDEATANIDSRTEAAIQRALKHLLKGRTSLIIAHRLSTVRDADRIIVVNEGQIVEEGSHGALLARNGLYAHLHSMSQAVNG